ncbi:hypothetical protein [Burkholderia sp. JP2-270]|uniref:DUF6988 family protein n=1 Tax=Burkholderia sp. JP2-270 TaxID=2217913 RepID=UPI0013A68DE6|nr:hypothetical protein [Burkholderia sp. JP2-270]
MTRLEEEFSRSVALSDWFHCTLSEEGLVLADRRQMIALAFAALCLEHRAAFLLLVEHGANAGAMALTRAVLEAHIRTLWAHEVASGEQIERFFSGQYDPKDLSVISWAGHIMRYKSHGYADEEEEANRSASGSGPRAAA